MMDDVIQPSIIKQEQGVDRCVQNDSERVEFEQGLEGPTLPIIKAERNNTFTDR